jgi:hypothetical protein
MNLMVFEGWKTGNGDGDDKIWGISLCCDERMKERKRGSVFGVFASGHHLHWPLPSLRP